MPVGIFPIDLGFDRCYLLKSDGVIAVDAGAPGKGRNFTRGLERSSTDPRDVRLVVITHGHWDHVGSAKEIKNLTGAKLAIHRLEADCLERSMKLFPRGATPWGRVFGALHKLFVPLIAIAPVKVDLLLDENGLSLADFGIPGRIFHTPGHTAGSVSVLLESGEAFVGDLAMNRFPLRFSPGLPIFADDPGAVARSWKLLLDNGATTVYPAHGKPFPADVIRRVLS